MIKQEPLRAYLSANIKVRRKTLDISQEKLAELADISVQMVKRIEGRRTWVSDIMLEKLARVLGVSAFQLLIPLDVDNLKYDTALITALLRNLRQNIQDDINTRFDRLLLSAQNEAE
jgi:transcriptional regulator with XRE-family HTH domain